MKKKSLNKPGMKINGNSFLLMVTVLLFIVMYAAGMVIFADKGFAKPQMFLNLFISNAGLLVNQIVTTYKVPANPWFYWVCGYFTCIRKSRF